MFYRAWPFDNASDPDIYMTCNDPEVSLYNSHWKSALIGPDRVDITPSDTKYKMKAEDGENPAIFFIGVKPFMEGLNTMMVSITLNEASNLKICIILFRVGQCTEKSGTSNFDNKR